MYSDDLTPSQKPNLEWSCKEPRLNFRTRSPEHKAAIESTAKTQGFKTTTEFFYWLLESKYPHLAEYRNEITTVE